METDWKIQEIIQRAYDLNPKYLAVVDDVVSCTMTANEIVERHGSSDLILSALAHVTRIIHGIGIGTVPSIHDGGWRHPDRIRGYYLVAPDFSAAWKKVRNSDMGGP